MKKYGINSNIINLSHGILVKSLGQILYYSEEAVRLTFTYKSARNGLSKKYINHTKQIIITKTRFKKNPKTRLLVSGISNSIKK